MRWPHVILLCLALPLLLPGGTSADEPKWGDLKMKFVYGAKPPARKPLVLGPAAAICGGGPLLDESLIVAKDGGLQNVIVYLVPSEGLKVHESYEKLKAAKVELDNMNCRFEPHIALIRTGQILVLKNSDPIGHNSKLDFFANDPVNPIIPAGGEFVLTPADLDRPEKRPTSVSCTIHPWMSGWVLVQDHPYMAVSGSDGTIEIKNLPVGKQTFRAWQESLGNAKPKASKPQFNKGVFEVEIAPGMNDLGVFTL